MKKVTLLETIEELCFKFESRNYDACVDAEFEFEIDPGEKATRDYPGVGPSAFVTGFKIKKVEIWNDRGELIDPPANMITDSVFPLISEWHEKNEDYLEEQAFETDYEIDCAMRDQRDEDRYNQLRGV